MCVCCESIGRTSRGILLIPKKMQAFQVAHWNAFNNSLKKVSSAVFTSKTTNIFIIYFHWRAVPESMFSSTLKKLCIQQKCFADSEFFCWNSISFRKTKISNKIHYTSLKCHVVLMMFQWQSKNFWLLEKWWNKWKCQQFQIS